MATFNRAGFLTLIAGLTGLQGPLSTVWARDAQPFVSPGDQAIVKCTLRKLTPFMWDETRYSYTPTTGAYTEQIYGVRDVTITIRVEQFAFQVESSEILELVKTSLQLQSVRIGLQALGLSLKRIEADISRDYIADNREVNMAQADFTFNVVSSVEFTQFNEGWIDTVDGDNSVPGTILATLEVDMIPQMVAVFSLSCTPVVS